MADKGSDGLGTGDSGYFSRRLPRGVYGSSNYPSYDREDSCSSRSGSLRSRLSDGIRPHSPLRRSDANTSSSKPPTGRDSSLRDSLTSSYSSPYSSLSSEPSLTRSSSYTRTPLDTTAYTSPYSPSHEFSRSSYLRSEPRASDSPSHESCRSSYLRSEPRASDQYQVKDGDRTRSSYLRDLRDDFADRSTVAYPEGYSSLGRRRVPFRRPDDAGPGAVTYERMEPTYVRGTRSVYEPHQVEGPYEPEAFDEGLGGYTSLPYNVYELTETVPALIESPQMRVYDHPLVDYPVDRRELSRTYSELGPPRGSEEDSTSRSPIMRKRGVAYHAQPGDTRADRIRQRYGGTDSAPSTGILREEYPGSWREYPGSMGRSAPRAILDEVSDTRRNNLSDPGARNENDYDAGILPGVPLPPNRAPPSYHDVLSDGGKKYAPLRQNSSDSLRSSVNGSSRADTGSSRADTGSILRRSQSQQDKQDIRQENSDVEDRYQSPSSTGRRKDFQQTRSSSKDQPDDSRPSQGGASNRAKFSKSRSSSKGSFEDDPGSGRRVRFGGFFDDFDRPSLFGRRGRSLFDAFDFNDEREKRRAKFRDMFDDQLSLLGRHRGLFNDWDPFNRSRSGSPQQRSNLGSPRSCSSPGDMPRSDSPRTSKTTIISETNDPKEGKKVVEITETSSPKTGRKRRTIKETKTSSLDASDGTRRTVTETKTETIEPNDKECEKDAPCDKSWKPIDERNLFDKYKFKFGSFGEFGSGKTAGRETLNFRDFDDLVEKFKNLHRKSRAEVQKEESDKEHEQEKDSEEKKTEEKKDVPKTEKTVEQDNKKEAAQNQNQKVEKDEKNKQIKVEQNTNEESRPEDKQAENTESKPNEKEEESDEPCGK